MYCQDIDTHFRQRGDWVDWTHTTDTFKAGDPSKEVRTVAVAWKANWDALRQAVDRGADLFISHESICVRAVNGSTDPEITSALPSEKPKFEWLAETGLTVYRCHDVWDRFPEFGIRDSWQRELDIGDQIVADGFPLYVTEIEPTTAHALAEHVLRQIRPLGQNGLPLSGNPEQTVHRVATGTGVTTDPIHMIELGADIGIITDDYYLHVRMGEHARELGFPTIVVNHGVSEEWGIRNLAKYLEQTFPDLEIFHIPQRCPYTVLT